MEVLKWEYCTVNVKRMQDEKREIIDSQLDLFGLNGWELVTVYNNELVFKRPLQIENKRGE